MLSRKRSIALNDSKALHDKQDEQEFSVSNGTIVINTTDGAIAISITDNSGERDDSDNTPDDEQDEKSGDYGLGF